jgi:hypothetical protein
LRKLFFLFEERERAEETICQKVALDRRQDGAAQAKIIKLQKVDKKNEKIPKNLSLSVDLCYSKRF